MTRTVSPDLLPRIARLIESFEGGGVAGDFDGMVLSWGPFQWNLGQGTLQPVLRRMCDLDPLVVKDCLGAPLISAMHRDQLVPFARRQILTADGLVRPEWVRAFAHLADTPLAARVFAESMQPYMSNGQRLCETLDFVTERAYALCGDIAVQNGGPRTVHIEEYRKRLDAGEHEAGVPLANPTDPEEWERLRLLARVVADLAIPRWRDDVYARKSTIALGRGVVHRRAYLLHEDFGIRYWACSTARTLAHWWVE
jgi:hypothetical protein